MSATSRAPRSSSRIARDRGQGRRGRVRVRVAVRRTDRRRRDVRRSRQRHDKTVEAFARAGVGCTTTLEFSETGEFFVFEETGTPIEVLDEVGCQPLATPGQPFGFEISGPADVTVPTRRRRSRTRPTSSPGASVATLRDRDRRPVQDRRRRFGREHRGGGGTRPVERGVELRRGAIVVAAAGLSAGRLLLALAGRRSKRAATPSIPTGRAGATARTRRTRRGRRCRRRCRRCRSIRSSRMCPPPSPPRLHRCPPGRRGARRRAAHRGRRRRRAIRPSTRRRPDGCRDVTARRAAAACCRTEARRRRLRAGA